ncbi:hypothetical protein [Marinobacter shengliensis]|uniref:hypothetical protein n=1 Tax=Marinobacter shengliensis TaxID=1389223 RepID=UPI001109283F|nr:hypothetical protein [Marinobacter shengliensis]
MSKESASVTDSNRSCTIDRSVLQTALNAVQEMKRGLVPFPNDIAFLEERLGNAINADYRMKGLYRCQDCYHQWELVDGMNAAEKCSECGEDVEPYFSGDPEDPDSAAGYALAQHEKRFPNPAERGNYTVEVHRTALRIAEIPVTDAAGPASAEQTALAMAPDKAFSSDICASYEIEGSSRILNLETQEDTCTKPLETSMPGAADDE